MSLADLLGAIREAIKDFGPRSVCWLCVLATAALGWVLVNRYATAAEIADVRRDLDTRAQASDLEKVRNDVSVVQLTLLQIDLIETKKAQCRTQTGEKAWYSNRIGTLQQAYRKMTGSDFAVPECEDL